MLHARAPLTSGRAARRVATFACTPGITPSFIFPFTPVEHYTSTNLHEFQVLMYRPLYWCGSGGIPDVDYARSLGGRPAWSPDGRTVTVTLKPWQWSNGEPLHADNIVFWMRLLQAKKERFGGYAPGYFPDNVVDFRAVDERTVSFTFDRPYNKRWVVMNQLSTITPLPSAWDRVGGDDRAGCLHHPEAAGAVWEDLCAQSQARATWAGNPTWAVVNGPWRLSESTESTWTFVPNESYQGPDRPRLAEFRQVATASNAELYDTLARGGEEAVDVGFLPPEFVAGAVGRPPGDGINPLAVSHTLIPQTTYRITYLPFNFGNDSVAGRIFARRYFRQAMQSLVDQETAIREDYHGQGYITTGPIPLLPESDLVSPRQRSPRFPFDIPAARRLLAANGWDVTTTPGVCVDPQRAGDGIPVGTPLRFTLRYAAGYPTLASIMERFRGDAARAGIELVLTTAEQRVIADEDTTGDPNWQLTCWNGGWIYSPACYPTGEALYRTGANMNIGGYADAKADQLIDRTVTTDGLDALYEYQDYIAEQAPVIWMPNTPARLLEVANDLRGLTPINPFGYLNPEDWYYERSAL